MNGSSLPTHVALHMTFSTTPVLPERACHLHSWQASFPYCTVLVLKHTMKQRRQNITHAGDYQRTPALGVSSALWFQLGHQFHSITLGKLLVKIKERKHIRAETGLHPIYLKGKQFLSGLLYVGHCAGLSPPGAGTSWTQERISDTNSCHRGILSSGYL